MTEVDLILMSLVIFLPTLFALCLLFFPRGSDEYMRWWALLGTAATLVVSIWLFIDFQRMLDFHHADKAGSLLSRRAEKDLSNHYAANAPDAYDLVARYPWISRFNIEYFLGIDGISMPLLLMTTALCFLAIIASWNITRHVRGYLALFLLLETGMIGTFLALDFFLFYIFWEVMLLPMYFLIGVWGGPRREYAAIKFFLYTLLGSVFILIALLGFYFTDVQDYLPVKVGEERAENKPANTFDLMVLHEVGKTASQSLNAPKVLERHWQQQLRDEGEGLKADIAGKDAKVAEKAKARQKYLSELAAQSTWSGQLKRVRDELNKTKDNRERESLKKDLVFVQEQVKNPALLEARKAVERAEKLGGSNSDDARRADVRLKAVEGRLENQSFFTPEFQYTMFLLLFIGFAIKVPLFPFHTWLPDAHVEAPTPISMILAGVLLKLGAYGILRIAYPICPWAAEALAWYIALFGIINIVYGALAAMAQTDFKKLVAYSSVSHMGYVILGIAVWSAGDSSKFWSWGMNGAMFQMIAHGITSAGMFFCVGVIYDRAHHRNLNNFRGLFEPMPLYGGISSIIFFAALGLPGMCGFVGEFMVILATWNYDKTFAILAALTVVLTAGYILWTMQRVYLGVNPAYKDYPDITLRELLCIVPLVILAVLLGVWPNLLLNFMEPHVTGLVEALAQLPR